MVRLPNSKSIHKSLNFLENIAFSNMVLTVSLNYFIPTSLCGSNRPQGRLPRRKQAMDVIMI